MVVQSLVESLDIRCIVTDGDLDGLVAAVILKRVWPNAEVIFSHPAEIRSGFLDEVIDERTALCDLPFHPACGLYIDHHLTNRPSDSEREEFELKGGKMAWQDVDSAARVAYNLFYDSYDLSSLEVLMPMVDKIDGGKISNDEFLSGDPVIWLSRTISASDLDYTNLVMQKLIDAIPLSEILFSEDVIERISKKRKELDDMRVILAESSRVEDRMVIVRIDETGIRTNGYVVTAHHGDDCDACIIIHGHLNGEIGSHETWPISASFYCNSFLHPNGGICDLTQMATLHDPLGGGHANACGCRLMPLDESGAIEQRKVEEVDIERNIATWMQIWSQR